MLNKIWSGLVIVYFALSFKYLLELTCLHFFTGTRPHSLLGTFLHCSSAICLQFGLATFLQLLTGMVWQSSPGVWWSVT